MYDVLRASYRFHCPAAPDGPLRSVPLSRFRSIERLPGAAHPAVYRVKYRCACGDDHVGLVSHDDLDYRPIGASEVEFTNLLTGQPEPAGMELLEHARLQVQRGNWPWRLYCCREAKLKPVFPSCLSHVAPGESELVGVAMTCPGCGQLSLNVVTHSHLTLSPTDRGSAVADIFRLNRQGKVVEHWDVIQDIPAHSRNGNGMF